METTNIQELILTPIAGDKVTAELKADRAGVLSGIEDALEAAAEIGLEVTYSVPEGYHLAKNEVVMRVNGTPGQMVQAEDRLIGVVAKPSGIATAAEAFIKAADDSFRVVCGSWKKVDASLKKSFRRAVETGGCRIRMLNEPMVYLDKNYIMMFGEIKEALEHVASVPELNERKKVVQVKGYDGNLALECWNAAEFGADVIYIDTGNVADFAALEDAQQYMARSPLIAFGGEVKLEDVEMLKDYPIDILGVGKAIIDAPMLDMKFNVTTRKPHHCDHEHEHKAPIS